MTTIQFRRSAAFARVAVVTALCMGASPLAPIVQAQTAAKAAVPKPAAQPAAQVDPTVDGGWPKAFTTNAGAALVVYQPQISSWADQRHLDMYSAVSYQAKGAPATAYGTIKVEATSNVSVDARLVSFSDFVITQSNFPGLQKDQIRDLLAEITESIPLQQRVLGLDRVLANLDTSRIVPRNAEGIKADPPTVFFSQTPAVLVNIDGDPIWSQIPGNDLRYAVNTNWDLFEHAPTKTLYLLATDTWLKATDVKGPWVYAGPLPDSFFKLPGDANFNDVKGALPGKRIAASQAPKVYRQQRAGRDDSPRRRAHVRPGAGREDATVGQQHRRRRVPNGQDGPGVLPRRGPLVLRARLQRAVDLRHAEPARGLQDDSARARSIARPGLRARHAASGRGCAARADSPDGPRRQERAGARRRLPGPAGVPAHRDDDRVARRQHGQGHLQGRRPLLHVLPGRVVHGEEPHGALGSDRDDPLADLPDSRRARHPIRSPT